MDHHVVDPAISMQQYGIGANALTGLRSSPGCKAVVMISCTAARTPTTGPCPLGSPNKAACAAMACAPYSMAQRLRNPERIAQRVVDPTMTGRHTDNVAVVPALDGVEQAHRPLMGNQFGNLQTSRIHDYTTGSHEITRLLSSSR